MPIDPTNSQNPMVLVEMTVYDPAIPGTKVLYFSDREFRTGAGDTPASTIYQRRISNPGVLSIDLIAGWAKGIVAFGIGQVQLVNTDGGLDALAKYTFDGWPVTFYLAVLDATGALTKTKIFTGTMENPDVGKRMVTVVIRSQMYGLDRPVVTTSFLGTGGEEGDSTIRGLKKPVIFGKVRNVPLILVDAVNLIYYVGQGLLTLSTATPDLVRDAGIELTYAGGVGTASDFATLQAFIVAPGSYYVRFVGTGGGFAPWHGTFVKLGSTPVGQVTASVVDQFPPASDMPSVLFAIFALAGGPTLEAYDLAYPVAAPHTFFSAIEGSYGRYIDDDTTYADVLGQLAAAVAGWFWYNTTSSVTGGWILQNLPNFDDNGIAYLSVSDSDIIDMAKIGNPKTPGEGIPPWSINYQYDRNELVQSSGLASGSAVTWRNFVAQQYRVRNKQDATVLTRYPLAQEITQTGRGLLMASPDTPSLDMINGYWDALHLGYDYYQITLRLSARLLALYSSSGLFQSWQPASMPWIAAARIGVQTKRFGFTTAGKGTMVAPMAVSLDLGRKRVTYIVRTTYQVG